MNGIYWRYPVHSNGTSIDVLLYDSSACHNDNETHVLSFNFDLNIKVGEIKTQGFEYKETAYRLSFESLGKIKEMDDMNGIQKIDRFVGD